MDTILLIFIPILFGSLNSQSTNVTNITVEFLPPYNPFIVTTDMAYKLLSCNLQSDPVSSTTWNWYHNGTFKHSINTYTIVEVNTSISGTYQCVSNSFGISASKQVIVQYGPIVTELRNQSINEHNNLVVRCEATGNPIPDITWSHDGNPSFQQNGISLVINNIQRSSRGTYRCTAKNTLKPSGAASVNKTAVRSLFVDVLYPPDIRLEPQTNPFIVYNRQTNVAITCMEISANPNTHSYRWADSANTTQSNNNVLALSSVSRSTAGDYTCYASNTVGTGLKTVTLKVQYAPTIQQISNQNVTEGGTLDLTCKAQADPPVSQYWWIRPDGYRTNSNRLLVTNINRNQNGIYTCYAENILTPTGYQNPLTRRGSSTVLVDVQYGPGNSVKYIPSTSQYNLTEGDILPEVTCSADCYPTCTFQWTTPVKTTNNHKLIAETVSKERTGTYTCFAANSIHTSTSTFSVIVNYKPSITKLAFQKPYVQENKKAILQCRVDSQPLSDMTIGFNSSVLFQQNWLNTKDYIISKSDCLDTGIYYCKAKNFVGETTTFTYLYVYCSPRLDSRIEKKTKKFILPDKESSTLNTTIQIIAFPRPEINIIFRDISGTIIPLSLQTDTIKIIHTYLSPILNLRLTIHNFTDEDHGEYIVSFRNNYGQIVYTIATKDIEEPTEIPVAAIVGSIVGVLVIIAVLLVLVVLYRKGFCSKLTTLSCCKVKCNCIKCKDNAGDKDIYANQEIVDIFNKNKDKQNSEGRGLEKETAFQKENPYQSVKERKDSHTYSKMKISQSSNNKVEYSEDSGNAECSNHATNVPAYVNGKQTTNKVNYKNVKENSSEKPPILPRPQNVKENYRVKKEQKNVSNAQAKDTKSNAQEQDNTQQIPMKINSKASPHIQMLSENLFGDKK